MSQLAQVMWTVSQVSFSLLGSAQGAEIGNDATVLSIQKNPELFKLIIFIRINNAGFSQQIMHSNLCFCAHKTTHRNYIFSREATFLGHFLLIPAF